MAKHTKTNFKKPRTCRRKSKEKRNWKIIRCKKKAEVTYLSPQPFSLNNDRKDQTSYNNPISAFYSFDWIRQICRWSDWISLLLRLSRHFSNQSIDYTHNNMNCSHIGRRKSLSSMDLMTPDQSSSSHCTAARRPPTPPLYYSTPPANLNRSITSKSH